MNTHEITTHQNFQDHFKKCATGEGVFCILTHQKIIIITDKTIAKFTTVGREVIKKSNDGRGFRLSSGKNYIYILPGQLFLKS